MEFTLEQLSEAAMRRWNGWGDESISVPLSEDAKQFLVRALGMPAPLPDVSLQDVLAKVPPSNLPDHPLISKDPEERLRHARGQSFPDWVALRSGHIGRFPDGVAYPENSAQVRELLSFASDKGIAVIPYGGGTSVAGHINPQDDDRPVLTIDMRRMNRLLDLDEDSLLATFGAGASGPDIEAQLRAHGYTLGHYPQSFEYSTLGGWVATRSSGQQSLYYGRIEQLFAGGTLETPRGTVTLPAFPASAAGPDLREMVLGSEGRLGILTEITVRIRRLPQRETFHVLFFPDWQTALDRVKYALQTGFRPSMLRLSNPAETKAFLHVGAGRSTLKVLEKLLSLRGAKQQKCMLTFAVSGTRRRHRQTLREAFGLFKPSAGRAISRVLGQKWVKNRFRSAYLRNTLWEMGYGIDTLETATNWDTVDQLTASIEKAIHSAFSTAGHKVMVFSHLSHLYSQGSSIYTTYIFPVASNYEDTLDLWARAKEAASRVIVDHGATITHHHGVGTDHEPYLIHEKGKLGLEAISSVCKNFDPQGIMNPGKLVR